MRAGDRPEIANPEETIGLRLQGMQYIGHSRTTDRIDMTKATPGKSHWLVIDALHSRVFEPIPEDCANLSIIHTLSRRTGQSERSKRAPLTGDPGRIGDG